MTDHFDGARFHNEVSRERSFLRFLSWMATRKQGSWNGDHQNKVYVKPPTRFSEKGIRVTFVNHSTMLIQVAGINILSDPIWSERCSPLSFIGPARMRAPGIPLNDLPPIDVVIISHNHYDHLDVPTLKQLATRDNPLIIAGLGNMAYFTQQGLHNVFDLDWWQKK